MANYAMKKFDFGNSYSLIYYKDWKVLQHLSILSMLDKQKNIDYDWFAVNKGNHLLNGTKTKKENVLKNVLSIKTNKINNFLSHRIKFDTYVHNHLQRFIDFLPLPAINSHRIRYKKVARGWNRKKNIKSVRMTRQLRIRLCFI